MTTDSKIEALTTSGHKSIIRKLFGDYSLFFLLIFLASISIFLFQNHKNGFGWKIEGHHDQGTALWMSISKNLIVDNDAPLLMFRYKHMFDDGQVIYQGYNRWPVFPHLITGIVIKIFEPNLALQIYMAKQVMNLFLLLSIIVCFKIVNELISDIFLSMSITLLAFSSYHILYYIDMVSYVPPALFGFVLALFLVVRSQRNNLRIWQIILLSLISISMAWHSYAVFLAWLMVDILNLIRTNKKSFHKLIHRPSFIAFATVISWGVLILGLQLLNEWMYTIDKPFHEISTVRSMLYRLNLKPVSLEPFPLVGNWSLFLRDQINRALIMIKPFAGVLTFIILQDRWLIFIVVSIFIYSSILFRDRINYRVFSIFLLSGVFWAIPMRRLTGEHDFETIFYIGFAIIFFILLSFYINPVGSKGVAIIACLLFILSVYQMNARKDLVAQDVNSITAEFQSIHDRLPKNSKIFVDSGSPNQLTETEEVGGRFGQFSWELGPSGIKFYLAGFYSTSLEKAEYIVSRNPSYNQEKLTNNANINLFKNVEKP